MRNASELDATMVLVSWVLAAALVDAFEKVDQALAGAITATFEGMVEVEDGSHALKWSLVFAVRVQLMLQRHKLPLAEALGRMIDCTLAASANGIPFKPWSATPLQALSSPSAAAMGHPSHLVAHGLKPPRRIGEFLNIL